MFLNASPLSSALSSTPSPAPSPLMAASSAAEWVIAALFGVTLVAAVVAGASTFRSMLFSQAMLELQQEQAEERYLQERRAQASRVAVVPTRTMVLCADPTCDALHSKPAVEIVNASEQAIFEVSLLRPATPGARPVLPTVLPMVSSRRTRPVLVPLELESIAADLTNPRFRAYLDDPTMTETMAVEMLEEWESSGRPSLQFTDASGQQWSRTADGALEKLGTAPEPAPETAPLHEEEDGSHLPARTPTSHRA